MTDDSIKLAVFLFTTNLKKKNLY